MLHNLSDKIRGVAAEASARFDLWASFINQSKVKSFAEIGVWRGEFAFRSLAVAAILALWPGLASGADEEPGLTRGQKTLLLNAGAAAALTTWGIYKWDYGQQSPNATREHWFGQDTRKGGADKLGHL